MFSSKVRGAWLLGLALLAFAGAACAQFQAGRDYSRYEPPQPVATGERIEVLEFFYYGCPVCYETQPLLSRWLVAAPEYISVRRVPVLFSESSEAFAKLFYALESMGHIGRLHWPIYDNFHFDGVKLNEEKVMLDWLVRNGIDRDKFMQLYASDEIKAKLEQARATLKRYDIRGVPSFVVDGKYLTSARLAGGTRQMISVLDHLVRQARKERAP
jgi:thiol:disulfide interchange protein DsbA